MKQFLITVSAMCAFSLGNDFTSGSWCTLGPGYVAEMAPVIIEGTITRVELGPTADRSFDTAYIRVAKIHRNALTDAQVRVGDEFPIRMSGKNSRMRNSTDLRYAKGTEAIWLVWLNEDGQFHVTGSPQQVEPVEKEAELRKEWRFSRGCIAPRIVEGECTKAQWVQKIKDGRRRNDEARKQEEARRERLQDVCGYLAKDGKFQADKLELFLKEPVDIRRGIIQTEPRQLGLSSQEYSNFVARVLLNDPDENVRSHAASSVGYRGDYPTARMALIAALSDKEPWPRLMACQSLMMRQDKSAAGEVARLLDDKEAIVRNTAVRAMGRLGAKGHIELLLKLYKAHGGKTDEDWVYADALCRLGEQDVSLDIAAAMMKSENWNVRFFVVEAMTFNKSAKVVPAAMKMLLGELAMSTKEIKANRLEPRVYVGLCKLLENRTEQKLGKDALAWVQWWRSAANGYGAKPMEFAPVAVKDLQAKFCEALSPSTQPATPKYKAVRIDFSND